jgi:hypothetical protein
MMAGAVCPAMALPATLLNAAAAMASAKVRTFAFVRMCLLLQLARREVRQRG